MSATPTLEDFDRTWRNPVFGSGDICELSGISLPALKKYVRTGVLFTESRYQTKKGKARGFSLGDLCQARAMGKMMEVFGMNADRARYCAWGFTTAMKVMAMAFAQGKDLDLSLLAVCWPYEDNRECYGAHAIPGGELQSLLDECIYRPQFCGLVVTRQLLWDTVVSPCLEFALQNMEARRDDALAK